MKSKAVKKRGHRKKPVQHRTVRKIHTESEMDLFDDISTSAKMRGLMIDAPLSILSESLDSLHYKEAKSLAEEKLLEELQKTHYERLVALVVRKDDWELAMHKKRLVFAPRPLKKSDRNLYWAVSRELRERDAFDNLGATAWHQKTG